MANDRAVMEAYGFPLNREPPYGRDIQTVPKTNGIGIKKAL